MSDDDPTRRFDLPDDGAPKDEPPAPESDPLAWLLSNDGDPEEQPPLPDAPTVVAPTAAAAPTPRASHVPSTGLPAWPPGFPAETPANDFTTQRFDQLPPDGGGAPPPTGGRGLLIGLAIAGGALVIAIVVLLIVIGTSAQEGTDQAGAGDGVTAGPESPRPTTTPTPTISETPSETPTPTPTTATPTPSATPTPTPSPTPTKVPDAASIGEFEASSPEVACIEGSTEVIKDALTFSYAVANASKVEFGGPPAASSLNSSGNFTGDFNCANASNSYTLTATGAGAPATVTIAVDRSLDTDGG